MSSSATRSFFISSTKEPPQKYRHMFKEVTKENLLDALLESSSCLEESVSVEITDTQLQALGEFTDNQMKILQLMEADELYRYIDMKATIGRGYTTVYHIIVSEKYLSENLILSDFIYGSIILEEREEI